MMFECRPLTELEQQDLLRLGTAAASWSRTHRISSYFCETPDLTALSGHGGFVVTEDDWPIATLSYFEHSVALLNISIGVVYYLSTSIALTPELCHILKLHLWYELRARGWSFVRWALPAARAHELVGYPAGAEVWFEVSKPTAPGALLPVAGMHVRVAQSQDLNVVSRMLNQSVLAGLNRFERAVLDQMAPHIRDNLHMSIAGECPLVLIAEEHEPVGCLFGDLHATSPHDGVKRARIIDAYVSSEYVGQGIATFLTQAFEALCSNMNIGELSGTVKGDGIASTRTILEQLRWGGWRADTMMIDFHPRA